MKVLLNIFLVLYYLAFAGVLYGVLATGGHTGSNWAGWYVARFFSFPCCLFFVVLAVLYYFSDRRPGKLFLIAMPCILWMPIFLLLGVAYLFSTILS